jgi:signal transduction histidine kinase
MSLDGVSVVDTRHLPFNKLPPPVHIEQIVADRKPYDANAGLRLPPLIRDLQIDYTALSLVAPEKMHFRYKLEGHDRDWVDAGTRRQAFYSDLRPRNYRFRVAACNNSGVWNEAGAFLDFSVAPTYYQTRWFQALCVAAFLALLGGLYRLRLRQLAWQFNVRLEERVAERTRIARDFHDTLLQSFQGVLMKFSAVTYQIPERPDVQKNLETILEQARQAVTEGREAVQGLRSSTVVTNDLARAIGALAEDLAARHTTPNCPEFHLRVEGESRDLAPIVRDDVHRIACEAVRNAFRHAQAGRIEVEIHYERRRLRLRVLDNGKGIDQKILGGGGRPGHFGLAGMQERAKLVGGKLTVLSRLEAGTEAELTIPASLAYAKASVERRSMSSGGGA